MMRKTWLLLLCGLVLPAGAPAQEADAGFELDARVTLDAVRATVEARLEGVRATLDALAATDAARSADWSRIREPLEVVATGTAELAAVWFARPDGSYFSVEKGLTGATLRDRDYFPALLAGRDVVGALVISKSTGARSVIVAVPVLTGGEVVGAIGASIDVVKLAATLDQAIRFPSNVIFYALDERGQTALHRASDLIFAFPSDMGSPTLSGAVRTMLAEREGVVSYDYAGGPRTALFVRSGSTGWVFVLGHVQPPGRAQGSSGQ